MPLLDIEKGIKNEKIKSRFRLAHLASKRARELNEIEEDTLPLQVNKYYKITTNAIAEIIEEKVDFIIEKE
jgi:DNA-directed RNA polymerase subunit omega